MYQYEFIMRDKRDDSIKSIVATAKTIEIARNQIAKIYTHYAVEERPVNEYPAHYFYNELDCSDCTN